MSEPRDDFPIMGFMKFYLFLQLLFPLALIVAMIVLANEPGLKLTDSAPFILVALSLWAIWHLYSLIKWSGFSVAVTASDITVGKRRVAWGDVERASVRAAFKFDTWIEIRPRSGEPLVIPAAVSKKDQLLTLVEKHHPGLVRK